MQEEKTKKPGDNTSRPAGNTENNEVIHPLIHTLEDYDYDNKRLYYFAINGEKEYVNLMADADGGRFPFEVRGHHASSTSLVFTPNLPDWISIGSDIIQIDPNPTDQSREFTATIISRDHYNTIQLFIGQKSQPKIEPTKLNIEEALPNAKIKKVKITHGREMSIHIDFDINNLKGKEIRAYALFYQYDGETPLNDENGKRMVVFDYATPKYNSSNYSDFIIQVENSSIFNSDAIERNGEHWIKIYIGITADEGKSWLDFSKEPQEVYW